MSERALLGFGSICLLACAAMVGCTGDNPSSDRAGRPDGPTVLVHVRPGGIRCSVRAVELHCGDVARHLRDTLKVKPDEYIAVEVDTTKEPIPFDSMTAVVNALKQSGFTTVIGSVPL